MLGVSPQLRVKVDKRKRVWDLSLRDEKITGEELPELLDGYTELRNLDLRTRKRITWGLSHFRAAKMGLSPSGSGKLFLYRSQVTIPSRMRL